MAHRIEIKRATFYFILFFLTRLGLTFDFLFVLLWPMKIHGSCVAVKGVDGVWVSQQLGQERFKDVGQI